MKKKGSLEGFEVYGYENDLHRCRGALPKFSMFTGVIIRERTIKGEIKSLTIKQDKTNKVITYNLIKSNKNTTLNDYMYYLYPFFFFKSDMKQDRRNYIRFLIKQETIKRNHFETVISHYKKISKESNI